MSSLTPQEKAVLENLFDMSSGYVLSFSDSTFGTFFGEMNIDIHSPKYQSQGSSKAKKLREFWRIESDGVVGTAIFRMVEHMIAQREAHTTGWSQSAEMKARDQEIGQLIESAKVIANRLCTGHAGIENLKESIKPFDAEQLAKQIDRIEKSLSGDDPSLAIGTAKELVETCCKTILDAHGLTEFDRMELIPLVKTTMKHLQLLPEDVPHNAKGIESIKKVLGNLASISQGLAELRNLYGTGHGKHGNHKRLPVRHARLAVGAATTLALFLFETHTMRSTMVEGSAVETKA